MFARGPGGVVWVCGVVVASCVDAWGSACMVSPCVREKVGRGLLSDYHYIRSQKIGTQGRGALCARPLRGRTQQGEDKRRPYLRPYAVSQCHMVLGRLSIV